MAGPDNSSSNDSDNGQIFVFNPNDYTAFAEECIKRLNSYVIQDTSGINKGHRRAARLTVVLLAKHHSIDKDTLLNEMCKNLSSVADNLTHLENLFDSTKLIFVEDMSVDQWTHTILLALKDYCNKYSSEKLLKRVDELLKIIEKDKSLLLDELEETTELTSRVYNGLTKKKQLEYKELLSLKGRRDYYRKELYKSLNSYKKSRNDRTFDSTIASNNNKEAMNAARRSHPIVDASGNEVRKITGDQPLALRPATPAHSKSQRRTSYVDAIRALDVAESQPASRVSYVGDSTRTNSAGLTPTTLRGTSGTQRQNNDTSTSRSNAGSTSTSTSDESNGNFVYFDDDGSGDIDAVERRATAQQRNRNDDNRYLSDSDDDSKNNSEQHVAPSRATLTPTASHEDNPHVIDLGDDVVVDKRNERELSRTSSKPNMLSRAKPSSSESSIRGRRSLRCNSNRNNNHSQSDLASPILQPTTNNARAQQVTASTPENDRTAATTLKK